MKTSKILYLCLLFPVFCSCGDNKDQKDGQNTLTTEQQASVHRMKDYDLTDSVTMGNHLFVYTIHREADDSLKAVVDENGDKYVDNYYDLTILRDGTSFFRRRFTKLSFGNQLDESFRKNGILDGFRYMSAKEGMLTFGVCVSFPESDMSEPFVLTVGPDGSFTLEPDTTPDIEETEDTSV
ncbi:MAG: DUF4738 domain-containing protein [Bacteroidaceae bacterium]|nr:DUF4738 domain-containing protein [Bacteroidaceae bacterium]MBR6169379.1 DUF4738 domain-containing protein [Bacteroidaceae bacterium]